jgi:hypothetical protein
MWLCTRCPTCTGTSSLIVELACGDRTPVVHSVQGELFRRVYDDYSDALDATIARPHATFDDGGATIRVITELRTAWRVAASRAYEVCFQPLMGRTFPDDRVLAWRCEHLRRMPVAVLALAASKARNEWPLDLHPRVPVESAKQAAARPWPCPVPSDTALLIGGDLGQGGAIGLAVDETAGAGLTPADLMPFIAWELSKERAVSHARARDATVAPLTPDAVIDSLEGRLGPHVQIVGHVERSEDDRPLLVCDGGARIDLRRLVDAVRQRAARGFRSPLRAVDLAACDSADEFSEAFHSAGVVFTSSVAAPMHPARALRAIEYIYGVPLLDGRTPFQHAWLAAESIPSAGGRRVSEQDEAP